MSRPAAVDLRALRAPEPELDRLMTRALWTIRGREPSLADQVAGELAAWWRWPAAAALVIAMLRQPRRPDAWRPLLPLLGVPAVVVQWSDGAPLPDPIRIVELVTPWLDRA